MAYFANRRGVRFGEHFFNLGEIIPDSVREQYPEPFDRAIQRGSVTVTLGGDAAEAAVSRINTDLSRFDGLSKAKLLVMAETAGIEVKGTGSGGSVLKADLISALSGVD